MRLKMRVMVVVQAYRAASTISRNQPGERFRLWVCSLPTMKASKYVTNNQCESFNVAFKHLVGSANPSLWTVSTCISEDAQMVCADIRRELLGSLPKKRAKKGTRAHQQTLKRLCNQYRAQETSLRDFLNEMGKSIRIAKKKHSLRK